MAGFMQNLLVNNSPAGFEFTVPYTSTPFRLRFQWTDKHFILQYKSQSLGLSGLLGSLGFWGLLGLSSLLGCWDECLGVRLDAFEGSELYVEHLFYATLGKRIRLNGYRGD
jgi:hypothetical protein